MDGSTADGPLATRRDGFAGQRMLVTPRAAVRASLSLPVTGRLLVTEAGVFPHATRHGRSRPDGAEQHILLVCTDGAGWCRTPAGTEPVGRGDAVLLLAGVPHEYGADADTPWTLWWFHVVGADAAELVATGHATAGGPVVHLRDAAPVASLVSQVVDSLDTGTRAGTLLASGAAFHALTQVVATGRRAPGPAPSPVERALDHLRTTSPRRTSVASLASMVGLSTSRLGALFREQVGVSPMTYQSQLRMSRARELLASTDLPVAAVAAASGYDDPLYFSRRFAQAHGLAPSAYRAQQT